MCYFYLIVFSNLMQYMLNVVIVNGCGSFSLCFQPPPPPPNFNFASYAYDYWIISFYFYIFLYLDTFKTVIPEIINAIVGETVKFICLSNSSVNWSFNGKGLPQNSIVPEPKFPQNRLTISVVKMENEGTYTCLEDRHHTIGSGLLKVNGKIFQGNTTCTRIIQSKLNDLSTDTNH